MSHSTRGIAALAFVTLALLAPDALAHGGGSVNYISTVRSAPDVPGVSATVQDRDDRLQVRNTGRRTVMIYGYNREPYARIQPGGRVQVNRRSPALYLNEDRFAQVDVPGRASAKAAPVWKTLDNTGAFDWHDHRIHWMVKSKPGGSFPLAAGIALAALALAGLALVVVVRRRRGPGAAPGQAKEAW